MRVWSRMVLAVGLWLSLWTVPSGRARAALADEPPAFDDTFHAYVFPPFTLSNAGEVAGTVAQVLAATGLDPTATGHAPPWDRARLGVAQYYTVDLPWNADLSDPDLEPSGPPRAMVEEVLAELEAHGFTLHMSLVAGMSRAPGVYLPALLEDRRNAQWLGDGTVGRPGDALAEQPWVTPSRYARKLRRHMEAKLRAFARVAHGWRSTYENTFLTASGDAEAELNAVALDDGQPFDEQVIADYSPFAVLEFRDWLLHAGLYAPGAAHDGEGYELPAGPSFLQGPGALDPANLPAFNASFATSFSSFQLRYFDWSLDDPVDGDPRAIPVAAYLDTGFVGLPDSGPDFVAGGFDAPRSRAASSAELWRAWLAFREQMIAHHVADFATWMIDGGQGIEPERWFSHQIPADYLSGRYPGHPDPLRRLRTSASPMSTAISPAPLGRPGLTSIDRFASIGNPAALGYERTSEHLFGAMRALGTGWGIAEYAPSWAIDVPPDGDAAGIRAQMWRALLSGARFFALASWVDFVGGGTGPALGQFLGEIGAYPRGSWNGFFPVTPCRVHDSRSPGAPLPGFTARVVPVVDSTCGIPGTASAIVGNLTVLSGPGEGAGGYLTAYPSNAPPPFTSSVNFVKNQVRANNLVLALSSDGTGQVAVFNGSLQPVDFLLDVSGYFQ